MPLRRSDEDKATRKAAKAHKTELARAKSRVMRLELEHRSAVKSAERAVKDAEGKPLLALEKASDFFGPSLKVFADRVETPKGGHPLTADLSARVEGTGRSLVVLIDGDEWGHTHDPSPDDTKKAHDFAREFNRLITSLPLDIAPAVQAAQEQLDRVREDRSMIEKAEAELRDLESRSG